MPDSASPARILIAEDVPLNRELVQIILEQNGYKVVAVKNGREAVTAAQKATFQLILMDIEMPEMDGIEAARQIREEIGITPETTPILATTSHAAAQDVARAMEAGIDDYLVKPLQADTLLKAVKDWLSGSPDPFAMPEKAPLAQQAPEDQNLFDPAQLDAFIRFIDVSRTRDIVKDFSVELTRLIESVQTHPGNSDLVQRELHTLASTAGNLGLSRLSTTARAWMTKEALTTDEVRLLARLALHSIDELTTHLKSHS